MFIFFYTIFALLFAFLDTVLDGAQSIEEAIDLKGGSLVFALTMLIPSVSVTVRRIHDTDRSGWWTLISLVPVVGIFILLFFMVLNSDEGVNRFGGSAKFKPALE